MPFLPPTDHECCTLKHNSPKLWIKKWSNRGVTFYFAARAAARFVTDYFDDARQNRNHNNPDDQQLKVILNHRDCTEEIACVGKSSTHNSAPITL